MMGRSHMVTGATAGAWLAAPLGATELVPDHLAVMLIPVTAYAALLPDIDHGRSTVTLSLGPVTMLASWLLRGAPRRWLVDGHLWSHHPIAYRWGVEHRQQTHRKEAAALAGALAAVGALFLPAPWNGAWWAWGLAVTLGCLAHCWADARTHSGIPHPLGRTDRRGRVVRWTIGATFKTGSTYERWMLRHRYIPFAAATSVASFWTVTL